MKDEKASIIAETMYRQLICRFGPPERLLSDRGSAFTGDVMARLCKKLGIKNVFTIPHHPQCDGMVETLNRTLLKDLRGYVDPDNKKWAELLPSSCLRYNTSRHSATAVSSDFWCRSV
jgi:transposase InsO family protein